MVLICGLNASEFHVANELYACDEDFPADMVDWEITKVAGVLLFYVCNGSLGLLVVVANVSLILGILRDEVLREKQYYLQVVGQAFTDLAVGLLVVGFFIGALINGGTIVLGDLGCRIFGVGIVGICNTTILSLSWIAYNRKVRILESRAVTKRKLLLTYWIGVWGTTAALVVFYASYGRIRMLSSGAFCNPIYDSPILAVCGILVIAPITYLCRVYYRIYALMRRTSKAVKRISDPMEDEEQAREQAKYTRLLFLMCFSILFMWIPLYLYFTIVFVRTTFGITVSFEGTMEKWLGMSAVVSSLCSPILYGFANPRIQNNMLFGCVPKSWQRAYEGTSDTTVALT